MRACYHGKMLNPFPGLLVYATWGPFILRLVLGFVFLDLGLLKLKKENHRWISSFEALHLKPARTLVMIIGVLEIASAVMLFFGFYTQIAALIIAIISAFAFYIEWKDSSILKRDIIFYLLVMAIAVSLLLTGAGAFAKDIPL